MTPNRFHSETAAFAARAAMRHPTHWHVVYHPETEDWTVTQTPDAPAQIRDELDREFGLISSTKEPSPEKDPFLAHEALDRAHVLSTMFDELLLDHAYIQANSETRFHATRISDALAELYQSLGRLTLPKAAP